MISFEGFTPSAKETFEQYLRAGGDRGCEYSFANLFLWGRKRAAIVGDRLAVLAEFARRSVCMFPVGPGDARIALDAVMEDARARGVSCCFSAMTAADCALLEKLYPGAFRIHASRDEFDYIYDIDDLADLKGRKFQKKRNHIHRFTDAHPDSRVVPLDDTTMPHGQWRCSMRGTVNARRTRRRSISIWSSLRCGVRSRFTARLRWRDLC